MAPSQKKQVCSRCVYDETIPGIEFDGHGVCNFCRTHDSLCEAFPGGEHGEAVLKNMADTIRQAGKSKAYDCIIGVSGGCDSSYIAHVAVKHLGLRPLAVHFNNGWNTDVAAENMRRVLGKLNIDLYEYTVDPKEYDDIYLSFLKAGVADIEAPTDITLAAVLNLAAEKHKVKYILEGHSFRTEGISPLGWLYMDGKYIHSIHKLFGSVPMKTYPNMLLSDMLRWMVLRGIQKFRPLWHMEYDKEKIKELLLQEYGWQWYGGHHLENRFTAFFHSYFMPRRVNVDCRVLGHAANVRTGCLDRDSALQMLARPHSYPADDLAYLKNRLNLSDEAFEKLMTQPLKRFYEYPTYKKLFERLRPFFWLMAKTGRIPWSFYMKYTVPFKEDKARYPSPAPETTSAS